MRVAGSRIFSPDFVPFVEVGRLWAVEHEMAGVKGLKVALLGGWVQPSKDIHFVAHHTRGMGVSLLRRNRSGRKILSLGGVDLIQL